MAFAIILGIVFGLMFIIGAALLITVVLGDTSSSGTSTGTGTGSGS